MHALTLAPRRLGVAAATVAGVLAAGTLVAAAPAQAAAPAASPLTWSISQQFVDHLSTRTLSDGATFDAASGTFGFPSVSTAVAADGTVTRTYDGAVKGAFANAGTELYSVTVSDPIVTVAPNGTGSVKATVSSTQGVPMGPTSPAGSTAPASVTVAEFTGTSAASQSITPAWAGVLPAGSQQATDLGIGAGKPVDGKSFNPSFLGNLMAGVRAHFYASGAASDAKKAPAALTTKPTVAAEVTGASYADGVQIKVNGTGFNPVTNPGDMGVYVVLAPAKTVIDFGNKASLESLPAADWVMPQRFVGDTFAATLTAPTDKLVPGTDYAIFTWQAHTHSNPGQDTVTPVTIDWAKLAPVKTASTVKAKVAKTKLGKKVTAKVTVSGTNAVPTGKVKVTLKKGKKQVKAKTATLNASGQVKVKLAKLKKTGKYKVVVKYLGDDLNLKQKATKKFTVKKKVRAKAA